MMYTVYTNNWPITMHHIRAHLQSFVLALHSLTGDGRRAKLVQLVMQAIHAGWDPTIVGVEGLQLGKSLFYGFYIVIHNLNTINTETMATDTEQITLTLRTFHNLQRTPSVPSINQSDWKPQLYTVRVGNFCRPNFFAKQAKFRASRNFSGFHFRGRWIWDPRIKLSWLLANFITS